jgi:L-lactate dehydrogenase (cytochrome)
VSTMSPLDKVLTVEDMKERARRRVPKQFFDYADSGSWTESTYRANHADFEKILLRQRIARSLEDRSLTTVIAGQDVAMPIALAPTGLTGMQCADGEIKAAKAAERAGVPFTLSTMSICSIEDVAQNTSRPFWFQLYVMRDRKFIERLIDRVKAAKCPALVLTMDLQILGQRHKDIRNGLSAPPKFTPRFLFEIARKPEWALAMLATQRRSFGNIVGHVDNAGDLASLSHWTASQFDLSLNWKDVVWIKTRFGGRVIVKGVLDPEDARLALAHGADGIIVSIYVDGGVYSGQDVFKAIALGARAAFIGRAFLWGLGAGGEAGVTRVLDILRRELDITMALCGERDIRNVGVHNLDLADAPTRVAG